jgi:hypothetical protein
VILNGKIKANGSYKELKKLEHPFLIAADSPHHEKKEDEEERSNIAASIRKRIKSETESLKED